MKIKLLVVILIMLISLSCSHAVGELTLPTSTPPAPDSTEWVKELNGLGKLDIFWIKDGNVTTRRAYSALVGFTEQTGPAECYLTEGNNNYDLDCVEMPGLTGYTIKVPDNSGLRLAYGGE